MHAATCLAWPRWARAVLTALWLAAALPGSTLGASAAPAAPAQPPALSLQQLFRQSAPAVVTITQVDNGGRVLALASGFVVSPSGVIVTNHHVIAPEPGAVQLVVKLPRGDSFTDVRIIYQDARHDLAVLSVKASGLTALKLGDSDRVEVGDQVVAIGNPEGLNLTFTVGVVEGIRTDPSNGSHFIQHQAPISPGSSGGPLLNAQGEVIGINTFEIQNAQNLNGAIPINDAKPYLGGAATTTWQQFAQAAPAAPAAPGPASGQAAPPQGSAPSEPGSSFFMKVSDYRGGEDGYRVGFTAGVYDTVSLFATVAQGPGGIDNQMLLALFQCVDGQGDALGQLAGWVTAQSPPGDYSEISAIVDACQQTGPSREVVFMTGQLYRDSANPLKEGFVAGVYDTISMFAGAAQGSGLDNQRVISFFRCLDSHGSTVASLRSWVDLAVSGGSPDDVAFLVVLAACPG
ncbi:MAG TPA: trypsin-like peptidase domain-containing protein [bacterium]|nr:trypsin-like peptidase domain-containing protein [bacterium]